jgi:hypothetical protein
VTPYCSGGGSIAAGPGHPRQFGSTLASDHTTTVDLEREKDSSLNVQVDLEPSRVTCHTPIAEFFQAYLELESETVLHAGDDQACSAVFQKRMLPFQHPQTQRGHGTDRARVKQGKEAGVWWFSRFADTRLRPC